MEWWLATLIIFGGMAVVFILGMPVAFGFMVINMIGVYLFWGGEVGLRQLILSIYGSITKFTLLPLILFAFMGVTMFESGMGIRALDALDRLLGRLPGRLGLLAVVGGTLFGTLSGNSMASTAMLGTMLVPEMEKRGYKKPMSLGPIIGSAGLATLVPPSGMAVFIAALGEFSVGATLIGGIVPGIMVAILYATYIIGRSWLQPHIAPPYEVASMSLSERLIPTLKYVLPLGLIIFMVTGIILVGVATPSEAAATGFVATIVLAACYRSLNWNILKKSIVGSLEIGVMVLMVLTGSTAFGQILSFSGGAQGLIGALLSINVPPIVLIIIMQAFYLVFGCFMGTMSMLMISFPIFIPLVHTLGFDPVWFGILVLLNAEMASSTPPFGGILFVMRSVAPPDTKIGDIYRGGVPFLICDLIVLATLIALPQVALWLPGKIL